MKFFLDEGTGARYLERLHWPDGFPCPNWGHVGEPWRMNPGLLLCPGCRAQTSVTAGVIVERTRKPLELWY